MNGTGAVQGEQCEILAVNKINPSNINPRTLQLKSKEFLDLVESVRAAGVKTPVLARPVKGGRYELMDGHRRLAACKEAAREKIPAVVYRGISDQEAFDITFFAFFNRRDLTPLEKGKAVTILLEKYKGDVDAVAAKLGKSRTWVSTRDRINGHLSERWQSAIADSDSEVCGYTATHLALIARLPEDIQDDVLNSKCDYDTTADQLEKAIGEMLGQLEKAPFDVNFNFKGIGPCLACRNRSSIQPQLWDDSDDAARIMKNDRCLDPECWANKTNVWLNGRKKERQTQHPNLVLIATAATTYNKDQELAKSFGEFEGKCFWTGAAKSAKGAIPAMVIHGPGLGTLRWIAGPGSGSGRSGNASAAKTPGTPKPLKERRTELASKRWFEVLRILVGLVKNSSIDKLTCGKDSRPKFILIAALTFGTITNKKEQWSGNDVWKDFFKNFEQAETVEKVQAALWAEVRPVLANRLVYNGPITQVPKTTIDEAKIVAGHLGIDIDEMYAEQIKAIKEPKSWKNLKADGTPKAITKKKTKKAEK